MPALQARTALQPVLEQRRVEYWHWRGPETTCSLISWDEWLSSLGDPWSIWQ